MDRLYGPEKVDSTIIIKNLFNPGCLLQYPLLAPAQLPRQHMHAA